MSALAHKYLIVENGKKLSVDGTSASAPVTAGIIALINEQRLANKQPPVGFINPALYAMAASNFNDVVVGNNTGTEIHGHDEYCFTYGYGASAGWDPAVSPLPLSSSLCLTSSPLDRQRNSQLPGVEYLLQEQLNLTPNRHIPLLGVPSGRF